MRSDNKQYLCLPEFDLRYGINPNHGLIQHHIFGYAFYHYPVMELDWETYWHVYNNAMWVGMPTREEPYRNTKLEWFFLPDAYAFIHNDATTLTWEDAVKWSEGKTQVKGPMPHINGELEIPTELYLYNTLLVLAVLLITYYGYQRYHTAKRS